MFPGFLDGGGRPRNGGIRFGGMGRQHPKLSRVAGFEVIRSLGHGGMSEAVNLVKETKSGTLYVEKVVKLRDVFIGHRARAELKALQLLNGHSNITALKTFNWNMWTCRCTFILEYCDKGSLKSYIKSHQRNGTSFPEDAIWHIADSVARALLYMHKGLVDPRMALMQRPGWDAHCHLDLKPCNIFLSSSGAANNLPRVVLGDFGCAVSLRDIKTGMEHPRRQLCGTPDWYPPEGLSSPLSPRTHYGAETDIWQLGATLHVACRLLVRPDRSIINSPRVLGRYYSKELARLVLACTHYNYRQRINAAGILQITAQHRRSRA